MNNPFARERAIFGSPAIGLIATTDTTGFLAPGRFRRKKVCSGRPAIGHGRTMPMSGTQATGARPWASTAVLIMASAIQALAFTAVTGEADATFTTAA